MRHLCNETASVLWLLQAGEQATPKQFRHYAKSLHAAEVLPDNLPHFLASAHTTRISELATAILLEESDSVDAGLDYAIGT